MVLVSKYFTKVFLWTQNNVVFETYVKSIKDVIVKGKERLVNGAQIQSISSPQVCIEQTASLFWKPHFRSKLKENASKISLQMSYRNSMGSKSFQNNLLWRQARKGNLIAFAGLFLFQEENQTSIEKFDNQFKIYESVCNNIKNILPKYEKESTLPSNFLSKFNDFVIDNVASENNETVVFNAEIKFDKNDVVSHNSTLKDASLNSSWDVISSVIEEKRDTQQHQKPDFAVKVVIPRKGVKNIETLIRDQQNELKCGGIDPFSEFEVSTSCQTTTLPPHPNILKLERAFLADFISSDQCQSDHSSMFQPVQKALFLVSKRYKYTLRTFLEQFRLESEQRSLLLLQLLEAVAHLEAHKVAHRNITLDSIFVDLDESGLPHLVLGEFGKSYLSANDTDVKIPFQHASLDTRLKELPTQAPEVSTATPGRFHSVDYSKSDVWSVGCIGYKIISGRNPFSEPDNRGKLLDSRSYKEEDLPSLLNYPVGDVLKVVIEMLLTRDPEKRLSATEAADILHLNMFALPPGEFLNDDEKCRELTNWLSLHCAEAIARKCDWNVSYQLCQCFFRRFEAQDFWVRFRLWLTAKYCCV